MQATPENIALFNERVKLFKVCSDIFQFARMKLLSFVTQTYILGYLSEVNIFFVNDFPARWIRKYFEGLHRSI